MSERPKDIKTKPNIQILARKCPRCHTVMSPMSGHSNCIRCHTKLEIYVECPACAGEGCKEFCYSTGAVVIRLQTVDSVKDGPETRAYSTVPAQAKWMTSSSSSKRIKK